MTNVVGEPPDDRDVVEHRRDKHRIRLVSHPGRDEDEVNK